MISKAAIIDGFTTVSLRFILAVGIVFAKLQDNEMIQIKLPILMLSKNPTNYQIFTSFAHQKVD